MQRARKWVPLQPSRRWEEARRNNRLSTRPLRPSSPVTPQASMGTASNNPPGLKFPHLATGQLKSYAHPDVLCRTFETLSNLHVLLPSHLTERLCSYKSEEDKQKCEDPEFSGLEKILSKYRLPEEVHLTPKPSRMPSWKRKAINSLGDGWKKCHLWKKNTKEPPMSTIVVRLATLWSPVVRSNTRKDVAMRVFFRRD